MYAHVHACANVFVYVHVAVPIDVLVIEHEDVNLHATEAAKICPTLNAHENSNVRISANMLLVQTVICWYVESCKIKCVGTCVK